MTPLFGRERDEDALLSLLGDPATRLLTLTGAASECEPAGRSTVLLGSEERLRHLEVVTVELLDGIRQSRCGTDIEVEHESSQTTSVDEDDSAFDPLRGIFCLPAEIRRGDEDAFARSLPLQSPRELLDLGPTDGRFPTFGLYVDYIKSKPIFVDDYRTSRTTGSFVLIDESTNQTVAAGVVHLAA